MLGFSYTPSEEQAQISSLTLGDANELSKLYCTNNKLTKLDISGCESLDTSDAECFKIDDGVELS